MPEIYVDNYPNRKQIQYKINKNGCWICTSHRKNKKGYARIEINGKNMGVHRYIYEKFKGEIPKGMLVCHKCDNPSCINFEHLWAGTNLDNVRDMISKGRQVKGEKKIGAKLNESQVIKIRESNLSFEELAFIYQVHIGTIRKIKYRERWKHIA